MTTASARRRTVMTIASVTALGLVATAAASASIAVSPRADARRDPLAMALERRAHPLPPNASVSRGGDPDLAPFGRMIAGADVVGIGEATHASTDFVTTKRRIFEYLVEYKGFTTFAHEVSWSTGLALDDYVRHGVGDPRAIMHREMQNVYRFFNTQELLDLIEWMRAYNTTHRKKLRFVGTDLGFAGADVFARVEAYVERHEPQLRVAIADLYSGLRADADTEVQEYMTAYQAKSLDERQALAADAEAAYDLLAGAGSGDEDEHEWAVQHAMAILQTATAYAFDMTDPEGFAAQNLYRDESMASNVAWWQRRTGDRVLLSAQNGHIGYVANDPAYISKPQGAFLREELGDDFVNVGFTFDRGSFHAFDQESFFGPDGPVAERHTLSAAEAGTNEYVLDQVRYDDYLVDLRRVPGPVRRWLAEPRATRNVGLFWPEDDEQVALGETYDLLIHLHDVEASDLLP